MISRCIVAFMTFSAIYCSPQTNLLLVQGEPIQIPLEDPNTEVKFSRGHNKQVNFEVKNQKGSSYGSTNYMTPVSTPEGNSMYVYKPTPSEFDSQYAATPQPQYSGAVHSHDVIQPGMVYTIPPAGAAGAPLVAEPAATAAGKNGKNGKAGEEKSEKKDSKKKKKNESKGGSTGSNGSNASKNNDKNKKNGAGLYIFGSALIIPGLLALL